MPKTKKTPLTGSKTRKSARKAPRKRSSKVASVLSADQAYDKLAYRDTLPFAVIEQYAMPNPQPENEELRVWDPWCDEQCKVAEAALEAGFKLAVDCPPNWQVLTAGMVAQLLTPHVYMGYDTRNEKLLVWIDLDEAKDAAE